jgi:hypothetical protein
MTVNYSIEIPEDFTPWLGGNNPVPGRFVEVIFRDGYRKCGDFEACWQHGNPEVCDIIAYRVIE